MSFSLLNYYIINHKISEYQLIMSFRYFSLHYSTLPAIDDSYIYRKSRVKMITVQISHNLVLVFRLSPHFYNYNVWTCARTQRWVSSGVSVVFRFDFRFSSARNMWVDMDTHRFTRFTRMDHKVKFK